jgi:L-ascorbate metabolism protein UlaG (beta-lactamase superfamily)
MHDSDHRARGRFFNPGGANGQPFWKVPRMLTERGTAWPRQVAVVPQRPPAPATGEIVVTFIGHATFLIRTPDVCIITDPVYARRAGPYALVGPARVREPGVRFDDVPRVSHVLLSHNHYDHCDLRALARLRQRDSPRVITLLGHARLLRAAGITDAEELDWWKASHDATPIWATPAQHFSARTPFDRNRALWGSFVVQLGARRILFAGDSGYGPHFTAIGERFKGFDLTLMPIGAYEPRWFMKDIHMNPAEAVRAHLDVRARRSIGMHFGTFPLTTEAIDAPVEQLERARTAAGLSAHDFFTLDVGSSFVLR